MTWSLSGVRSWLSGWLSVAVAATTLSLSASARAQQADAPQGATPAQSATPAANPPPQTKAVILVTIDGVRWQEVFEGTDLELARRAKLPDDELLMASSLLPNLYRYMVSGGVGIGAPGVGEPMMAAPAALSLPGYMELLGGRKEERCVSNRCPATQTPTLLDQVRRRPGARPDEVAAISSWEVIERAATNNPLGFPMSYGRNYGITRAKVGVDAEARKILERSAKVAPFPGYEDYRPDAYTAPLALRYLQAKKPTFLYVGLGDPDEYGHRGDYRAYQRSLREADAFIGQIFASLSQMGDYGASTTVIVTTDHGRGSPAFEHHGANVEGSRRVWLFAAGGAVPKRGLVPSPTERRLADVAPTVRKLLGLKADTHKMSGAVMSELLEPPPEPKPQAVADSR